jgi:hypothetical protein
MKRILGLVLVFAVSLSAAQAAVAQDSTVVVFRRSDFTGSALKPSIYVDGNQASRLGNGRYLSLQVAAGKHSFESSAKNDAPLEVEVKPNETVYLEMIIVTGPESRRPTDSGRARRSYERLGQVEDTGR